MTQSAALRTNDEAAPQRIAEAFAPDTIDALLKDAKATGTPRTTEGARHPDRDERFRYINEKVKEFTADGAPVISVDAKKKVLGDYAVAGREWYRAGQPVRVRGP